MEIEYTTEKEDLIAFNLYHNWQTPSGRKRTSKMVFTNTIWVFILGMAIVTLMGPAIFDASVSTSLLMGLGVSIVAAIIFPVYYIWYIKNNLRKQVSKSFDSGKNTGLLCKHKLVLNEDGLSATSDFGESRMRWGGVERVEQNDDHIFIYYSSMTAIPLNKKHFHSESAAADFFSFAAEHIEKAQQAA